MQVFPAQLCGLVGEADTYGILTESRVPLALLVRRELSAQTT